MRAKLRWWLDYIAYELRDPYDVDGNIAWAERLERRHRELWG